MENIKDQLCNKRPAEIPENPENYQMIDNKYYLARESCRKNFGEATKNRINNLIIRTKFQISDAVISKLNVSKSELNNLIVAGM